MPLVLADVTAHGAERFELFLEQGYGAAAFVYYRYSRICTGLRHGCSQPLPLAALSPSKSNTPFLFQREAVRIPSSETDRQELVFPLKRAACATSSSGAARRGAPPRAEHLHRPRAPAAGRRARGEAPAPRRRHQGTPAGTGVAG